MSYFTKILNVFLRTPFNIRKCSAVNLIENGSEIVVSRRISQVELDHFAALTGDENPIHTSTLEQNERFVNGAFLNAIVSGIIGTKFPGPGTIVISQSYCFPNRCRINDDILIRIKLVEKRKILKVSYCCTQHDLTVFKGDAKLTMIKFNKSNI